VTITDAKASRKMSSGNGTGEWCSVEGESEVDFAWQESRVSGPEGICWNASRTALQACAPHADLMLVLMTGDS
jgi:hypothetical protein